MNVERNQARHFARQYLETSNTVVKQAAFVSKTGNSEYKFRPQNRISISISWFFLARSGKYRDGELYCVITSFVHISLIHYSLVIVNTRLPSQRRYLNGK